MHAKTLKTEVTILVNIGIFKRENNSEWATPAFVIPNKNGAVRFISDIRELNGRMKRKPFPIPNKTGFAY